MRDVFVRTITQLAPDHPELFLITGDLGFGVLTDFANAYPRQYLNAGVAEQNMTGLAVGLALEGRVVFTYSIANFPTLRCLEQIRNDACYHRANVKIVAIGGGFAYGPLGASHHATEDLAVMRAMPNLTLVAPGDLVETAAATRAVFESPGPCYLRLGRGGEAAVHTKAIDFQIGRALVVREGREAIVISTGGILANADAACQQLNAVGLQVGLISMHTLKPIDRRCIEEAARQTRRLVTVEEHSIQGGLGSAVAEVVAQMPDAKARLKMIGIPSSFPPVVGGQEYLRHLYGLSADRIAETVRKEIAGG
jgi:transketolase